MISNAYDMLALLRDNVDEAVAAHWSDLNLMRRLNQAYYEVARLVSMSAGQWLIKSASVTASSSVITLPDDCMKPIYLEDSSGNVIEWLASVAQRRVSRIVGTTLSGGKSEAYPLMNTIEVNEDSFNETCTLWYQKRIVDLHEGTAAAGGATSLTLADSLRHNIQDDHYNGAEIEVVGGTGVGRFTISDYVASTRVLTLASGTFGADSVYGIVPSTPPECNDVILLRATILTMSKPSSNLDEKVFQMFVNDYRSSKNEMIEWLQSRVPENQYVTIGDPLI